jgi:hypothetical protein
MAPSQPFSISILVYVVLRSTYESPETILSSTVASIYIVLKATHESPENDLIHSLRLRHGSSYAQGED